MSYDPSMHADDDAMRPLLCGWCLTMSQRYRSDPESLLASLRPGGIQRIELTCRHCGAEHILYPAGRHLDRVVLVRGPVASPILRASPLDPADEPWDLERSLSAPPATLEHYTIAPVRIGDRWIAYDPHRPRDVLTWGEAPADPAELARMARALLTPDPGGEASEGEG